MSLFGPDMTDDFVKFNNFRVSTLLKHLSNVLYSKAAFACWFLKHPPGIFTLNAKSEKSSVEGLRSGFQREYRTLQNMELQKKFLYNISFI
jgi:hypothetical protein